MKENMYSYTFRQPNKKLAAWFTIIWGVLLCLSMIVISFDDDLIFIPIGIILVGTVAMLVMMFKCSIDERVCIMKTGIRSHNYGAIDFSEMSSVYALHTYRTDVLIIKLKKGKKIRWVPPISFASQALTSSENFYALYHQLPKSFEVYQQIKKTNNVDY